MAFPFTAEENFESGGVGDFNSETDTDSRLDFPHFSELAAIPGTPMPWRGAYCMRVKFGAGFEADAYVQENDDWDIASDGALYFRFMMYVDPLMTMSDGDEVAIFALQSTGGTNEAQVAIKYTTAAGFQIGIGELSAASLLDLPLGRWLPIEVYVNLDDGGSDDGTIDLWVEGGQATQVASLDQASIVQGILGVSSQATSAMTGNLYFDDVLADDARLYWPQERYPVDQYITDDGHVFVGPGFIENATLIDGGSGDCTLDVYDTDTGKTVDANRTRLVLKTVNNDDIVDPAGMPTVVKRGAYAVIGGTNPRAMIKIRRAPGYGSEGATRIIGRNRTASGVDT